MSTNSINPSKRERNSIRTIRIMSGLSRLLGGGGVGSKVNSASDDDMAPIYRLADEILDFMKTEHARFKTEQEDNTLRAALFTASDRNNIQHWLDVQQFYFYNRDKGVPERGPTALRSYLDHLKISSFSAFATEAFDKKNAFDSVVLAHDMVKVFMCNLQNSFYLRKRDLRKHLAALKREEDRKNGKEHCGKCTTLFAGVLSVSTVQKLLSDCEVSAQLAEAKATEMCSLVTKKFFSFLNMCIFSSTESVTQRHRICLQYRGCSLINRNYPMSQANFPSILHQGWESVELKDRIQFADKILGAMCHAFHRTTPTVFESQHLLEWCYVAAALLVSGCEEKETKSDLPMIEGTTGGEPKTTNPIKKGLEVSNGVFARLLVATVFMSIDLKYSAHRISELMTVLTKLRQLQSSAALAVALRDPEAHNVYARFCDPMSEKEGEGGAAVPRNQAIVGGNKSNDSLSTFFEQDQAYVLIARHLFLILVAYVRHNLNEVLTSPIGQCAFGPGKDGTAQKMIRRVIPLLPKCYFWSGFESEEGVHAAVTGRIRTRRLPQALVKQKTQPGFSAECGMDAAFLAMMVEEKGERPKRLLEVVEGLLTSRKDLKGEERSTAKWNNKQKSLLSVRRTLDCLRFHKMIEVVILHEMLMCVPGWCQDVVAEIVNWVHGRQKLPPSFFRKLKR